jgi:hypothetical protein
MEDLSPSERLRQRAELAIAASSRAEIEHFLTETGKEVLMGLARNPHLQERDLLRMLERKDLPHEVLRELAHHREVKRNYTVQLALVRHPKTPRLVSLPILKFLYVFDLVRVAQTPAVPTDVKMVAEETILKKLAGMPRGERISLARRGTGRVAAGLLLNSDPELIRAALDNPYITEGHLLKVLAREGLPPVVVEQVAHHERWSHHYHLRLALIRNPLTPFARVLAFLPDMAVTDLRDICLDHRMPEPVRKYIEAHCAARLSKQHRNPPLE